MQWILQSRFWRKFFVFKINRLEHVKDRALKCFIVSNICTGDNPSKQTTLNRFADIDQISIKYLSQTEKKVIHDIAVSTGVTSVEFFENIRKAGLKAEFFISDKYSVYRFSGKKIIKIFDPNGNLMSGYIFFLVADNNKNISPVFFASRWLFRLLRLIPTSSDFHEVHLYDTAAAQYVADGEIGSINYDIFATQLINQFTFVRCMNLLNLEYFGTEQILLGLNNILASLKNGGVFQIGRTLPNGSNTVSYYQKVNNKFSLLEHIKGGTEIKKLIESI